MKADYNVGVDLPFVARMRKRTAWCNQIETSLPAVKSIPLRQSGSNNTCMCTYNIESD